jgi:hypothetical protein
MYQILGIERTEPGNKECTKKLLNTKTEINTGTPLAVFLTTVSFNGKA